MVYANSRSMNAELNEGSTDGKYKKVINNRGGSVEHTTQFDRDDLNDIYFGIHEASVKVRPDSKTVGTPNYVYTRDPQQ